MANTEAVNVRDLLGKGLVIPACPLALTNARKFDERRQRALLRYYFAAGAGGIAVGVHTTQFAIRDPDINLYAAVLELGAEEAWRAKASRPWLAIAGVCGKTKQALGEAALAASLSYDAALVSLSAFKNASEEDMAHHCARIAEVLPVVGFYLQPAVGGRVLTYSFWRAFLEIKNVVAIKIAPFNRYQTLDVVRALADSGREDVALYTGNDDNIVMDLLTPFRFSAQARPVRIVGGLLGHWAVWTKTASALHAECRKIARAGKSVPAHLIELNAQVTDANAAFFDAANGFAGCIAGLHEVLRRQGLLKGIWCLNPNEGLSPGQRRDIDRVYQAYPHLNDDEFVAAHLDEWLR